MMRAVRFLRKLLLGLLAAGGVFFFGVVALSFTTVPWRIYRGLAHDPCSLSGPPDYIVVLGGGGIPSESGLMRTYRAAEWARQFPSARVVAALPGDEANPDSSLCRMVRELVLRGVARERIQTEPRGQNTREQALRVRAMLPGDPSLLLVTSPPHMRRALLTFRKAGFTKVAGAAAFNESAEMTSGGVTGGPGETGWLARAGESVVLRYDFWNRLGYLGQSAREYAALAYYWLRGWI